MSSYTRSERTSAMLCHLAAFIAYYGPFGGIIATGALWLAKRDDSAFVENQGKEALNFQLSVILYYFLIWVINLAIIYFRPCGNRIMVPFLHVPLLGLPLFALLFIFAIVSVIVAALHANKGEKYHYKGIIRFIK